MPSLIRLLLYKRSANDKWQTVIKRQPSQSKFDFNFVYIPTVMYVWYMVDTLACLGCNHNQQPASTLVCWWLYADITLAATAITFDHDAVTLVAIYHGLSVDGRAVSETIFRRWSCPNHQWFGWILNVCVYMWIDGWLAANRTHTHTHLCVNKYKVTERGIR